MWTTAILRPRQKVLVFDGRTSHKQNDASESIGNSCQNSHKRKNRGGENDDVEKKWKLFKSIGFLYENWEKRKIKEIWSLPGRKVREEIFERTDTILYMYYYNLEKLYESL